MYVHLLLGEHVEVRLSGIRHRICEVLGRLGLVRIANTRHWNLVSCPDGNNRKHPALDLSACSVRGSASQNNRRMKYCVSCGEIGTTLPGGQQKEEEEEEKKHRGVGAFVLRNPLL